MQITVFGASGKVGQLVAGMLSKEGYTVVAFVHRRNPFGGESNVRVVTGSIDDQTAVAHALEKSDAVISTLGSWGSNNKDIVSQGTRVITEGMKASGASRLIAVTGAGAWCSTDKPSFIDRCNHSLLKLLAPKILADGEGHLRILENSDLQWTSVRSPAMTSARSPDYKLADTLPSLLAYVPRIAVAQCLVDQLKSTDNIRKAPVIGHV